ncbi:MAG: hypothetical protein WAS25_06390 [Geothrix sp.]|uniref:hypothetical protein n=1 Tax=Geothrix sp. TaxID=1962974 RepID=UPI003BAF5C3F
MTSHYDPEKKCRIGLMDEKQFFSEANEVNGVYFKALLGAWRKQGGSQQWGAGGLGLRSRIEGKEVGICFLAPAFAGKKDRIELSFTNLAKQVGPTRCETLKRALQAAAGDHFKGTSMVSILDPGDLPPASCTALTTALTALL